MDAEHRVRRNGDGSLDMVHYRARARRLRRLAKRSVLHSLSGWARRRMRDRAGRSDADSEAAMHAASILAIHLGGGGGWTGAPR